MYTKEEEGLLASYAKLKKETEVEGKRHAYPSLCFYPQCRIARIQLRINEIVINALMRKLSEMEYVLPRAGLGITS